VCAVQNIALRGRRDDGNLLNPSDSDSSCITEINDGNFRTLLRLRIDAGDIELKENIQAAPSYAKYTSKTIQNELIEIMGNMVKSQVVERANKAKFWTLLADETTDRQKREQMVLVCRYVWHNGTVYVNREDPFSVVDALERAESLKERNAQELRLDGATIAKIFISEVTKANLGRPKFLF
jgi:hypothetical protein